MSKKTQHIAGFDVIGISVQTSNENDRAVDDINGLWGRFYSENIIDLIPNKLGQEIYAVYSGYEGDQTKPYSLTIGCKVTSAEDIPENLRHVHVEDGDYQTHQAVGQQPQALIKTWHDIWNSEAPRKFTTDYEIYGPRFFEEGLHEVLVRIGVK